MFTKKSFAMRCLAAVVLMAISGSAALAWSPLDVPICANPPILDGKLDDPVWVQAVRIEHLYKLNSDIPAPETTVYLARDNAWLYIAAQCRNPNMPHVEQLVFQPDGSVQTDDSLEILLRPTTGANDVYYHFILNCGNVPKEQRCNKAGLRDVAWNPPWRTMALRQSDGWTAELAIPLFCLETEDLRELQINIARTMVAIALDAYGAKQKEQKVGSMLLPGKSGGFHDVASFGALKGLTGFKPEIPFAPRIGTAAITGLVQDGGTNFYVLKLQLEAVTPVTGMVSLCIFEDFGAGAVEAYAAPVNLSGVAEFEFKVPAGDLRQRKVAVFLRDPADGNLLAQRAVSDTSALDVIRRAFVGRSYYTSEDAADIRLELGLPREMLAQAALTVEADGRKIAELSGLQPKLTLPIPVGKLQLGDNSIKLRILAEGCELAMCQLNIVRLEPRPGYEVKSDLARGVLLKDGKPIIPVGIYASTVVRPCGMIGSDASDKDLFQYLGREIGLNLIVARDATNANLNAFIDLAEQCGLFFMSGNARVPLPIGWKRGAPLPSVSNLSLPERIAYQRKWYEAMEPWIASSAEILRDSRNFIGYYNGDEPNLINPDERIAAVEWYWKTVQPLDPYRPHYVIYSQHIPDGDIWTRWSDIVAMDIYPRPFMGGLLSEPGLYTAYYAYQLRERCRRDNKIMWFVPLANMLDLGRTPIGMSRAQMLCQAYTALIYGARGLKYFAVNSVVGEEAWDALRVISAQVKELTPALANGDVEQQIKYTPDDFRPLERKFPMINAALFQYPDGDYLLLAVNIMASGVETRFKIAELQQGARLFGSGVGKLKVADESFSEKIEPYGVRAWRLKLVGQSAPVAMNVDMQLVLEERAPANDVLEMIRRLNLGKNCVPNPCFEQQINKGAPDFYRPFNWEALDPFWGRKRSGNYVDEFVLWNGRTSFRMVKFADPADGFKTRGLYGSCYPAPSDQAERMVFSFYGRSETPDAGIWIRVGEPDAPCVEKKFKLNAEWARYHASFDLPPRPGRNWDNLRVTLLMMPTAENAPIWISGLQIEKGDKPTEFRDDSVNRAAVDEPGNLLRNGGAEYGSADGWLGLEDVRRFEFGVRSFGARSGNYVFGWQGQSGGVYSEWVKIDPAKSYLLRGWFKAQSGKIKENAASERQLKLLFGLAMADERQQPIKRHHIFSVPGTLTELIEGCASTDRCLRVRNASAWQTGAGFVAAFAKAENTLTFDVTPPGIDQSVREGESWLVQLTNPCGIERERGAPLMENQLGNNAIFAHGLVPVADNWTEIAMVISSDQWWPGAAYAQVVALVPGEKSGFLMDDVCLKVSE